MKPNKQSNPKIKQDFYIKLSIEVCIIFVLSWLKIKISWQENIEIPIAFELMFPSNDKIETTGSPTLSKYFMNIHQMM